MANFSVVFGHRTVIACIYELVAWILFVTSVLERWVSAHDLRKEGNIGELAVKTKAETGVVDLFVTISELALLLEVSEDGLWFECILV